MKNKTITITFTSKFDDFEVINSEFTKCKCYALAAGDNENGSDITLKSIKKAIERGEFYNKPVVAHLYKDEDGNYRVGGHDSKVVISNKSIEIIDETVPFGTIPENNNIYLEDVLEPDGITTNTYLVMDIILWTGRYNILDAKYNDDIYFNQSCELSINNYHYKDNGVVSIDDFTFLALCLLNKSDDIEKNVRPCFPSCRVEKIKEFSVNETSFVKNYKLLLENFRKFSIDNKKISGGKEKMDFKKINESISVEKFKNSIGEDVCKYRLINATESKIFALDMEDLKTYGFDYAITSTNDDTSSYTSAVIDFDSKTEMSLSATEKIESDSFNGLNIYDVCYTIIPTEVDKKTSMLKNEYEKDITKLTDSYNSLNEKYQKAMNELNSYREKENFEKAKKHKDSVDKLFEKYSEKLGKCADFLIYKANTDPSSVSLEEVNEKLTLMAGKYMMEGSKKKSFSYNPIISGVSEYNTKNDELTKRYGHLLDKYVK